MNNERASSETIQRAALNILSLEYFNQIFRGINHSLNVILLKGEAILDAVTDVRSLRRLAEIDILIKKENFSDLKSHLSKSGYKFSDNIRPSPEVGYINSVMGTSSFKFYPAIHLHWHLVNNSFPSFMFASRINIDEIWQEARPVYGLPDNILIMAPHHQLIYLSEHGLKHSFEKPKDLRDIYNLIERYRDGLDWKRVISDAKEFNLIRAVYYGLYFTKEILGAKIPEYVLSEIKPKKFTSLERRFIRSVFNNRQNSDSSYVVYLAMNERFLDKVRFIYRTLFPPRAVMGRIENLPAEKVSFVHYLSRIWGGVRFFRSHISAQL